MSEVKLWQMNESDVYAASTADEALQAMAELHSYDATPEGIAEMREEYGVDEDYPAEITGDALDARKVNIGDPDGEEEHLVTYREHLTQIVADGDAPCLFSTTEY